MVAVGSPGSGSSFESFAVILAQVTKVKRVFRIFQANYFRVLIVAVVFFPLGLAGATPNGVAGAGEDSAFRKPSRIASAAVGLDEMLVSILAPHQLGRIVALSPLVHHPTYSNIARRRELPSVPEFGEEFEALLTMRPDLVLLTSYNRPELEKSLMVHGVPAITFKDFRSLADIMETINIIGEMIGEVESAATIVHSMEHELQEIAAKWKRHQATVLNYSDSNTLLSNGTLFASACEAAGVINLAGRLGLSGWPSVSAEVIAQLNPDFVVVPYAAQGSKGDLLRTLKRSQPWSSLAAVRGDKVVFVPNAVFYATSHHILGLVRILNELTP